MINPHTKFEVSMFMQYEDMKGNAKCRNLDGLGLGVRGHPRSLAMSSFDIACTTSYSTLIETMRLACSIFKFLSYLSKVADCNLPHLHLAPQFGVTLFEFRGDLWHQKTRVPELSCGVACVILCLAVLIQYRRVTDRRTHDDGQYRASIASRGKKYTKFGIQWLILAAL